MICSNQKSNQFIYCYKKLLFKYLIFMKEHLLCRYTYWLGRSKIGWNPVGGHSRLFGRPPLILTKIFNRFQISHPLYNNYKTNYPKHTLIFRVSLKVLRIMIDFLSRNLYFVIGTILWKCSVVYRIECYTFLLPIYFMVSNLKQSTRCYRKLSRLMPHLHMI